MKIKALLTALAVVALAGCSGGSDAVTTVSVDSETYAPGDTITVTYDVVDEVQENAWIGIIPAETAHGAEVDADAVDVNYEYFTGAPSGTKTFPAPATEGTYDVRVFNTDNSDGLELATSETFEVKAEEVEMEESTASLTLESDSFAAGDEVVVTFDLGEEEVDATAWIGIVPSSVSHGSEATNDSSDVAYEYLSSQTSGTMTFTAPEAGEWDLRLNSSDSSTDGVELAHVMFTVE